MLVLSVAAFLLLPRGDSSAVGYQEVAALPITGDPEFSPAPVELATLPQGGPLPSGSGGASPPAGTAGSSGPESGVPEGRRPGGGLAPETVLAEDAFPAPSPGAGGDDVVMHVRSPVGSYWRGQVYDLFDGRYWHGGSSPGPDSSTRIANRGALEYTQTYFIHRPQPGSTYMGYRGVEALFPEEAGYQESLGTGLSYKIVSLQPDHVPGSIREDRPGRGEERYYRVPSSLAWLGELSEQVTAGAGFGFDRAARIVNYLRSQGRFDASAQDQLKSSAPLDAFLLDGEPGSSMDFATANVMLARAAGLPARLATGYLPGERDLLSGAYAVRDGDAHAWAEILFEKHGWVPFDGTERPDLYAAGRVRGDSSPDCGTSSRAASATTC